MNPTPQAPELVAARLTSVAAEWGLRLSLAVLVVVVGYLVTRLAQRWIHGVLVRSHAEQAAVLSVAFDRIVQLAGFTLVVALTLAVLGVNVAALVAGLGRTSVALGFALKDTNEQAITGMLLLLQQPFRVGDLVEIDDAEGTVTEVGIRTTALRTVDGVHVLVPNNTVYQSVIRNKSRYPARSYALSFSLAPGTDLAAAASVLSAATRATTGIVPDPPPQLTFEGFTDSGIRASLRYWVSSAESKLPAQSELTRALAAAASDAGIDMSPPALMIVEPVPWRAGSEPEPPA